MSEFLKFFIIAVLLVCTASMAQAQPYLASNGEFINLDELRVGGDVSLLKAELEKGGIKCLGTQHELVIMLDPRNTNWDITTNGTFSVSVNSFGKIYKMRYVIESVPMVNQYTGQSNLRAMIDYYTRVISNNSGGFPYVDASLNPESDIMILFREYRSFEYKYHMREKKLSPFTCTIIFQCSGGFLSVSDETYDSRLDN